MREVVAKRPLDVQQGHEPVARGVEEVAAVLAQVHAVDARRRLRDDHTRVLRPARLARVKTPDHAVLVSPVHGRR